MSGKTSVVPPAVAEPVWGHETGLDRKENKQSSGQTPAGSSQFRRGQRQKAPGGRPRPHLETKSGFRLVGSCGGGSGPAGVSEARDGQALSWEGRSLRTQLPGGSSRDTVRGNSALGLSGTGRPLPLGVEPVQLPASTPPAVPSTSRKDHFPEAQTSLTGDSCSSWQPSRPRILPFRRPPGHGSRFLRQAASSPDVRLLGVSLELGSSPKRRRVILSHRQNTYFHLPQPPSLGRSKEARGRRPGANRRCSCVPDAPALALSADLGLASPKVKARLTL